MSLILSEFFKFLLESFALVISVILAPIDAIISNVIPNFELINTHVLEFLNYFMNYFRFVMGWIHIPPIALDILVGYITFRVILFFGSLAYKITCRWMLVLSK